MKLFQSIIVAVISAALPLCSSIDIKKPATPNLTKSTGSFGNIPLYFIKNEGQVNRKALFYSKTPNYTLWITKGGLIFDSVIKSESKRALYKLSFKNANKTPVVEEFDPSSYRVNFFKGKDQSKWIRNAPTSKAVLYKELYKNIDLKIYGKEKCIEYDWIVEPGGNPENIRFDYKLALSTEIDEAGNILIKTEAGNIIHKAPVSYQEIDGQTVPVESSFVKKGKNSYGIKVGKYNKHTTLIIDPVVELIYSTYLGGSSTEFGKCIAVGANGSAYVSGYTSSSDFPLLNAYQAVNNSLGFTHDLFITKFSPDGQSLIYSTYLGGTSDEISEDIAVDNSGSAYITGYTESNDFPVTAGAFQTSYNFGSEDIFVTKLSADGSSLVYSTYLGGMSDDRGYNIKVDGSGQAYIAGYAVSSDYPATPGAFQATANGSGDAIITKLSSDGSALVFSTFLGGSNQDYGYGIDIDSSGNIYIAGYTSSTNFPLLNPYQAANGGGNDIFISKLNSSGSNLIYSTYLGGNGNDRGSGIAVDSSCAVYVSGETYSVNFPVKNAVQATYAGSQDAIIAKLSSDGTSLIYSSYFGGTGYDYCKGVVVDSEKRAIIAGDTQGGIQTVNPIQSTLAGSPDSMIVRFSNNGSSIDFSTYFGGNGTDILYDIVVDSVSNIYITGETTSGNYPLKKPYQNSSAGIFDAFVTKIGDPDAVAYSGSLSSATSSDANLPLKGDTVNITVKVINGSSTEESNVVMTDSVPQGLLYVSSKASTGTYDSSNGKWSIGTLAKGDSATLTLTLKVNEAGIFNYQTHTVSDKDSEGKKSSTTITTGCPVYTSYSGSESTVSPAFQKVVYGSKALVKIHVHDGDRVVYIKDNGVSKSTDPLYYIENIKEEHRVEVLFERLTFTVSAIISEGKGKISQQKQTIRYGDSATVNITPDPGYEISEMKDNSRTVGVSNPYIIKSVKENHNVEVKLKAIVKTSISAMRKTEKVWLISKEFGEIRINAVDPAGICSSFTLEYSKDGGAFTLLETLTPTDFSGNSCKRFHKYLDKNSKYSYRLTAKGSKGNTLSQSTAEEK